MKKQDIKRKINRIFTVFLAFFYGLLILVAFLYLIQFKIVSNQREQQVINETIGRQSSVLHNMLRELRQSGITIMTSPNIVRLKSSKLKNYDRIQAQRELASFVASSSFLKSAYLFNFSERFVYSSDEQYFSADFSHFQDKNIFDYLQEDLSFTQKSPTYSTRYIGNYGQDLHNGQNLQSDQELPNGQELSYVQKLPNVLMLEICPSPNNTSSLPNISSLQSKSKTLTSKEGEGFSTLRVAEDLRGEVLFLGEKSLNSGEDSLLFEIVADQTIRRPTWFLRNKLLSTIIQSDNNMSLVLNIDPHILAKLFSQNDTLALLMQNNYKYYLLNGNVNVAKDELDQFLSYLESEQVELKNNARVLFSTPNYCIFSDKIENSNLYLCYMVPMASINNEVDALAKRIMLIFVLVLVVTIPSFMWTFRLVIQPFAKTLAFLETSSNSEKKLNLDDFVINLTKRMAFLRLIENRASYDDLRLVSAKTANRLLVVEAVGLEPQSKWANVFEFATVYILICTDENLPAVIKELELDSEAERRIYLSEELRSPADYHNANVNLQELLLLDKFFSTSISDEKIVLETDILKLKNTIECEEISLKNFLELDYEKLRHEIDNLLEAWSESLRKYRAIPLSLKLEKELLFMDKEMREGEISKKLSDVSQSTMAEVKKAVKESILQIAWDKYEKKLNRNLSIVEKVKTICQSQMANPNLSLKLIASQLNLNSEYLGRIFKEHMSMSVTSYINGLRLQEAEALLLSTELSHQDICKLIGLENSAYFYTLFKNEFKMTPGEYRKCNK